MKALIRTAMLPLLVASSCFCFAAGCAVFEDRAPASSARILLGPNDVVDATSTRWGLEDYTCRDGVLVCEDRGTKLRCRCSPRVLLQTLNAVP